MSEKRHRLAARLPRGFADRTPGEIAATRDMLEAIRRVYERYGFEAVETPAFEYTDALGKFLPDQDRPNEGVFSVQDDDGQWMSLRYDLTAPLARYVAENFDRLPKPYRSYRAGWVFRNEKPGPGRFRQFMQFDADTVGSASVAADAEMCMMAADTLEALGIKRGDYVIKVNNRKVLDGVMEAIGLGGPEHAGRRLQVLRAIDKLDRLGWEGGVELLLGDGRKDESGDFTRGAGLDPRKIKVIKHFFSQEKVWTVADADRPAGGGTPGTGPLASAAGQPPDALAHMPISASPAGTDSPAGRRPAPLDTSTMSGVSGGTVGLGESPVSTPAQTHMRIGAWQADELTDPERFPGRRFDNMAVIDNFATAVEGSAVGLEGVGELQDLVQAVRAAGYGSRRIRIDPSVVRGLEYYTGPVYEAELTFQTKDDDGRPVRFGSVGGGGRYDGLVARFRGEQVPATGFSIGVSRLAAALTHLGQVKASEAAGPVIVVPRTAALIPHCMKLVQRLREAPELAAIPGFAAEMYLGTGSFKGGLRYADKRTCACAIMIGESEAEQGKAVIKDLIEGAREAQAIATNEEYRAQRLAQFEASDTELVDKVREVLLRHR